jgi:hypothetical protein
MPVTIIISSFYEDTRILSGKIASVAGALRVR